MPTPQVLAIVLNWNRPDDTRRCVQSLLQSDCPNLRIVVVDNGSEEKLYAQLRAELTNVEVLRSEVNLGFAAGNNLGLRYAQEHGADYALVLNNDTLVDPSMVSQLVAAGEANPDAGLMGPIIYFLDQPDKVWFAGYRFTHGIYLLRRGLHLSPPIRPIEPVDFVSGCGMLIRRSVLDQVGLFCADYFMYYEDVDLCFRVKSAGAQILCVTDARMWHAVSASSGGPDSPIKQYHQVKSSLIFYRKHSRGLKLWFNIFLRMAHAFAMSVQRLLHGQPELNSFRMIFKGAIEGWRLGLAHDLKGE